MRLVTVQGAMQLAAPAAAAWAALVDEVRTSTGIRLTISSPGGAWRSEEIVIDMWRNPAKYGATKGTARPKSLGGPGSVHENGLCVDIWNWAALGTPTLDHHAARHGFRRTITSEPWHYQHNGAMPAGIDVDTFPTLRKRRPMLLFHTNDSTAPRGIRYHIITADGREAQFTSGGTDFPNGVAGQLGSSILTDRALLDALKRQLRDSGPPAGTVTLDAAAIVDELAKRLKG